MNIAEIRAKYPQYSDLSDAELARGLHEKFYKDVPYTAFLKGIDFSSPSDPTEGMTEGDKFLSGAGKAFTDIGRGVGQLANVSSQSDVDEAKRLDAPLMRTGYGVAGNVAGNVAALLPTLGIPGVNTVAGSAALGAASGALGPVASDESRLGHTFAGGAFGGGGAALARGGGALLSAIKPFLKSGQEELAAKVLARFANDPEALAKVGSAPRQIVPGSHPTLAEATGDPGIAQLQRAAQSGSPDVASALAQRGQQQNAARLSSLRSIGKDEQALTDAAKAREAVSGPLYEAASKAKVVEDKALVEMAQRPSFQEAMKRASALMAEKGIANPSDGELLHAAKMALDDMVETSGQRGIGAAENRAVNATRQELLGWLEKNVPGYAKARSTYQKMSKPIGQMKVGQYLTNKLEPALNDFGSSGNQRAATYAQALRDAEGTAQKATGFDGAKLDQVMTPQQMATLKAVAQDLARKSSADNLARGVGSNTAQNVAGQSVLSNILGGIGLPGAVAESSIGRTIARPLGFALKEPEQRVQQMLADALLNPKKAARLMKNAQARKELANALSRRTLRGAGDAATVALPIGVADAKE